MKRYLMSFLCCVFFSVPALCATVVATVNGTPITDTDITVRTKLMARQGQVSTDNRRVALQNIIDDSVKLNYAANFGVKPTDEDAATELKRMNLTDLGASERAMALSAIKAGIAWQVIVARTILPTIDVSRDDVTAMKNELAREQGLPIEMTIVRLTDVPVDVVSKLTKPKNCDDAVKMAEDLGGYPQKFVAKQYELSPDIRSRVVGLPTLTWSPRVDDSVLLVCSSKKTSEYGKLDDMIKQNATFQQAMFVADQQLKQLRRKAVVVINDDRYKL